MAYQRYRRDEGAASVADSLTSLLEDHILPHAHMVKGESFRKKRVVSPKVEAAFQEAMPTLGHVFQRYSGKHMLPGDAPFMALDEWTALCGDCGILSTDGFTTRDTNVIFVASLETRVDELGSDDSQRMHFYEFLEALARCVRRERGPGAPQLGARERTHALVRGAQGGGRPPEPDGHGPGGPAAGAGGRAGQRDRGPPPAGAGRQGRRVAPRGGVCPRCRGASPGGSAAAHALPPSLHRRCPKACRWERFSGSGFATSAPSAS